MSNSSDIVLSKTLSRILRHQAKAEGIPISKEGFVKVSDLLAHKYFRGRFNVEDIKRVVATNDKKRFTLQENNGILEICANQGHSISDIDQLNLIPINEPGQFDVIHGTYFKNWKAIQTEGLRRMNRNHIHFAPGLPADKTVISGMRKSCQVYIYVNLKLALDEGIKFFKSSNGVILSAGNENGTIPPKYFLKVVDTRGRKLL